MRADGRLSGGQAVTCTGLMFVESVQPLVIIDLTDPDNFWSLLKRSLKGTYVAVESFHVFRYIDEQAFRYNNRNMSDIECFVYAMRHVVDRRLTYKELTGKQGAEQHG